jgi:hypothetical protein
MVRVNNKSQEESEIIKINPAMKRHFELEIETLQNAPRDEDKLRELLKLKEKQNEQEATHIEETQKLVTEIEMLKFVLSSVSRKQQQQAVNNINLTITTDLGALGLFIP